MSTNLDLSADIASLNAARANLATKLVVGQTSVLAGQSALLGQVSLHLRDLARCATLLQAPAPHAVEPRPVYGTDGREIDNPAQFANVNES